MRDETSSEIELVVDIYVYDEISNTTGGEAQFLVNMEVEGAVEAAVMGPVDDVLWGVVTNVIDDIQSR
jgi:hypothetical protein